MKNGFTMVELIAVIVIMSLIVIIAVPTYTGISDELKDSNLKSKENTITLAMEKYANAHLLDEIKPEDTICSGTSCRHEYDLYNYIVKNQIYAAEEYGGADDTNVGDPIIRNPKNKEKLCGKVVITYVNYELSSEFVETVC